MPFKNRTIINRKRLITTHDIGTLNQIKDLHLFLKETIDNFEKVKYGGNVLNETATNGNYPNESEKRKENDGKTSSENKK